jgi:peptide/nickel transport system permease protein
MWFILRRGAGALLTLGFIAVFLFVLVRLTPGGPAQFLIDPDGLNTQNRDNINRTLGLDRPLHEQLAAWLGNFVTGNIGGSYFHRRPALEVVLERLPYTLGLATAAFTLCYMVAIWLGLLAARRGGWLDRLITGFVTVTLAFPLVWVSLLFLVIFSAWLPIFPSSGAVTLGGDGGVLDYLWHLALPTLALATHSFGAVCLAVRNRAAEELHADYCRVAFSKGLSQKQVARRHALRLSLNPAVALAAISLPGMVSGSIAVETVFGYPGVGLLAYESFRRRDYPVAIAIALIAALVAILASWAAEFISRKLDPRLSAARGEL